MRRESCVFARRIHDIIATCLNLFLTAGTGQGSVYRTSGALPQGAHRRSQGSCSGHLFRKVYGKFTLFNLFVVVLFFSHAGGEEEVRETNGQIHPESRAPFESVDQETGRCPSGGKHVDVDC